MITTGWLGIKLLSAGFRSTSGINATVELFEKTREDLGKDSIFLMEDTPKKPFPSGEYEALAGRIGLSERENGASSALVLVLSADPLQTEDQLSRVGIGCYRIIDLTDFSLLEKGEAAPGTEGFLSLLKAELERMKTEALSKDTRNASSAGVVTYSEAAFESSAQAYAAPESFARVYADPGSVRGEMPRQTVRRSRNEKVRKRVSEDNFKAYYLLRINFLLVLINVVVFFVSEWITTRHPDVVYIGALKVTDLYDPSKYYHFLTAAFAHFGIEHLAGNMTSLFFIGPTLEEVLGKWKYLMMYLISAVMANVLSVIIYTGMGRFNVVTAGASGAVYAVMGGMIAAMICKRLELRRTNTLFMIAVTAYMLFSGFFSRSGVNNSAHAVGLFFGFMICFLIFVIQDQYRKHKRKQRGFQ